MQSHTVWLVPKFDSEQVPHALLRTGPSGERVRLVVQLAIEPYGHLALQLRRQREERRPVCQAQGCICRRGNGVVDSRLQVCVIRRAISASERV